MKIKLKKCNYDDWKFILKLKRLSMKWYIEKIYGWDINFQIQKTKLEINKFIDTMKIIVMNNKSIGVTNFFEDNNEYVIGLILIHPNYQRKGIGTEIIKNYINIAKKEKKTIKLSTYKYNLAKKLYERLCFIQFNEDDTHIYLHIEFNK